MERSAQGWATGFSRMPTRTSGRPTRHDPPILWTLPVFLLATAFSATDEDLLLNRALTISQLGGTAVPVVVSVGSSNRAVVTVGSNRVAAAGSSRADLCALAG